MAKEAGEAGGAVRGRPDRRTLAEHHDAVLQVLMGNASIDQVAARMGVPPATIEQWRGQALAGMSEALLRGDTATPGELFPEDISEAVQDLAVDDDFGMDCVDELPVDDWAA